MGSIAFKYELVQMSAGDQWNYYNLEYIQLITFYLFCAISVTLMSLILSKRKIGFEKVHDNLVKYKIKKSAIKNRGLLWLSAIIILVSILVKIPLPGGTGSFSSIFFMYAAIYFSTAQEDTRKVTLTVTSFPRAY